MPINVFTPNEKRMLDDAEVNTTGRYLLCCVCSATRPTTLEELAEYTGFEKEGLRKAVKQLERIGVVKVTKRHKQPMLIEAAFP